MFNFFVDNKALNNTYTLTGNNYNHAKNVLRMKEGEKLLVSHEGVSSLCEISRFTETEVICAVLTPNYQETELLSQITLFQGMPKSDKLEFIIQKAVELGVYNVVPTENARSVVKIEGKKLEQKRERWQAISESAAKQCKRNIIPNVSVLTPFKKAVLTLSEYDLVIVPYECANGMQETVKVLNEVKQNLKIAVFIGCEGGFENSEIELLKQNGAKIISLGKRILRTETAALTTLSMLMLELEKQ